MKQPSKDINELMALDPSTIDTVDCTGIWKGNGVLAPGIVIRFTDGTKTVYDFIKDVPYRNKVYATVKKRVADAKA